MKRQEILLNLTLITIIGALSYSIYDSHQNAGASAIPETHLANQQDADDADAATETSYDPSKSKTKFPKIGETNIFQAILTPTPAPPTPTPKPTDTPNIQQALNGWKLQSVYKGVATIEDVVKSHSGAEDAIWDMKVGDIRPVDIGGGQTRPVKLESTDETTNPDAPTATFSMQDTQATRVLKFGDEAGASASLGTPGAGAPAPR